MGGSAALISAEHRPPYTDTSSAFAARGSMPTTVGDSWSGGFGITGSVVDDAEFIHLMGRDPARCDP